MSDSQSWAERLEALRLRLARSRAAPEIAVIVALAVAFGLNLWARHGDYFFYDEYEIVLDFRSLSDLFHPSNGHPLVMWLAPYYLMREVFGLDSALPYELVGIGAGCFAAGLLFVEVRRRAGAWSALVAAILLLFIASGIDILFWSFELAFAGSVSAGIGAVMALDRHSRRGDLLAALLLVASVFFLLVGLPFVAAAAVAVLIAEDGLSLRDRLRRLALVVGPVLVLFVVWYLAFGHLSPSRITSDNVLAAPSFVLDGIGSTLAFLVGAGVSSRTAAVASDWAIPLLVGALALVAWRCFQGPPVSRRIWIWVAGLLALWVLTAVGNPAGGQPDTGRYLWPSAALIILIGAELVRGLRLGWTGVAVGTLLVVVSVLGSRGAFDEARGKLASEATSLYANLGALEIARDTVDPRFQLTPEVSGSPFQEVVIAGSYFESADSFGSPAYDPQRLLHLSPVRRANVDSVLRAALPVELVAADPAARKRRCVELAAGTELTTRGSIWLRAGAEGAVPELRRFADTPAPVGELGPDQTAVLSIPADRSDVPWRLALAGGGARVCRL